MSQLNRSLFCFRTDSETTDDQCIPESISEIHDSAIDSTEDNDEEDLNTVLNTEDEKDQPLTASSTVTTPRSICLEVRDSSTESDKTVLSMATFLDQGSMHTKDSLPSTPGKETREHLDYVVHNITRLNNCRPCQSAEFASPRNCG